MSTESQVAISDLLTIQEAAQRKGVSLSTVYKAMRDGRLATQKVLGRTVILTVDVDQWQPQRWGGPRRGKKATE